MQFLLCYGTSNLKIFTNKFLRAFSRGKNPLLRPFCSSDLPFLDYFDDLDDFFLEFQELSKDESLLILLKCGNDGWGRTIHVSRHRGFYRILDILNQPIAIKRKKVLTRLYPVNYLFSVVSNRCLCIELITNLLTFCYQRF